MARPLLLPDSIKEGSWDQWRFHFLNVAAVNEWNEEHCLKCLKVHLTGRDQIVFQRLPPEIRDSYDEAIEAPKERFEPSTRTKRYQPELLASEKRNLRLGETLQKIFNCWPIKRFQTWKMVHEKDWH